MDYILRSRNWFANLYKSLSVVRTVSSKAGASHQIIKGVLFVFVGLLLAATAHEWSSNQGAKIFGFDTWPREKVFNLTLTSLGFKKAKLSTDASLLENHPDPYKVSNAIWVRQDYQVIYISSSPYLKSEAELWVKANVHVKGSRKLNWMNLTSGITAFNALSQALEGLKPDAKIKAVSRNVVDPKEIRY